MLADRNSKNLLKLRAHYFLVLLMLLHSIFYFVYWLAIGNTRGDVDQFIAGLLNFEFPYITIVLVLTALFGVWSLLRFVGLRLALSKGEWKPTIINWVYFGISIFFLVLFYLSFVLILRDNPSQQGVINQLLNLMRLGSDPFLFLISALWLRRMILHLRKRSMPATQKWPWSIGIVLVLISLVGLWLLPALFPPNWAYQGDLPAKPALIAHRGASMLSPENTLASAKLAAEYQAFGFESDVRISYDGVPFLMHDETLERTTNIAEVYPDRINENASNFTMGELDALNAGLWFIQKDPFKMIESGMVSQKQLSINQGQKIPTLEEALRLVAQEDMVILFDMRYPPEDHPYHDEFFDIVFTQCKESGLNGDLWFLVDQQNVGVLLAEAPQMTRAIGIFSQDLPDPSALLDLEYEIVNVDTGIMRKDIQAYRQRGLGVNIYTIDQPWLFSQFWLSGVTSVTTNNIQSFSQLDQPYLNVPYSRFLLFWSLFGIIIAIWLASSQPRVEVTPEDQKQMDTPDLMDFALEEEEQIKDAETTGEPLESQHLLESTNMNGAAEDIDDESDLEDEGDR